MPAAHIYHTSAQMIQELEKMYWKKWKDFYMWIPPKGDQIQSCILLLNALKKNLKDHNGWKIKSKGQMTARMNKS